MRVFNTDFFFFPNDFDSCSGLFISSALMSSTTFACTRSHTTLFVCDVILYQNKVFSHKQLSTHPSQTGSVFIDGHDVDWTDKVFLVFPFASLTITTLINNKNVFKKHDLNRFWLSHQSSRVSYFCLYSLSSAVLIPTLTLYAVRRCLSWGLISWPHLAAMQMKISAHECAFLACRRKFSDKLCHWVKRSKGRGLTIHKHKEHWSGITAPICHWGHRGSMGGSGALGEWAK